jgi:predicted  nucleic acid-binding Zn-ribbon protein
VRTPKNANLAEAVESASQRIVDAQQHVIDARQKVADAQEKLAHAGEHERLAWRTPRTRSTRRNGS